MWTNFPGHVAPILAMYISVRIKLKVPATQRHHRERAALSRWLAISKVRFLYGLPTYALNIR